tara:strand:+ start:113843 stop:114385 length:543 start_codon:yes stop_codon:yes gene_type:complete
MHTFIALLRGINVSGQKKIKMADFRVLLESIGFKDVQTYIQSGNIVFKTIETNVAKLTKAIESCILKEYQFEVPVLIITPKELQSAFENNHFLKDPTKERSKIGFTFLSQIPTQENRELLKSYSFTGEEMFINGKVIYLYSEIGFGRAKFTNNFVEKKLKLSASSRNVNTVVKLLEMAKG